MDPTAGESVQWWIFKVGEDLFRQEIRGKRSRRFRRCRLHGNAKLGAGQDYGDEVDGEIDMKRSLMMQIRLHGFRALIVGVGDEGRKVSIRPKEAAIVAGGQSTAVSISTIERRTRSDTGIHSKEAFVGWCGTGWA